jgi:hypothetical protein
MIETYIIRIYRRDQHAPYLVVGNVHVAGSDHRYQFATAGELWRILQQEMAALAPDDEPDKTTTDE